MLVVYDKVSLAMAKVSSDTKNLLNNIQAISNKFASERAVRQKATRLSKADFDSLKEAGFLLMAVPEESGGFWRGTPESLGEICQCLRVLAHGDSSVALVASMHSSVLASWLCTVDAPSPFADAWKKQRAEIFDTVHAGAWWGTITSEPGSGGDILKTKTQAKCVDGALAYRLTGEKHFGSGLGMVSYMVTTALPESEKEPELFFLDVRNIVLDGSTGAKLIAEWEGHGMRATQSHAVNFANFPATRIAWTDNLANIKKPAKTVSPCLFTSVIVGIVQAAFTEARLVIKKRKTLTSYERVEWVRACMQEWQIEQAYCGMLSSIEKNSGKDALMAKTVIAELAESALFRLCKILGGGTYSCHSPFGFWAEDVRALGFLRPPWALAFDNLGDELSAN